MGSARSIPRLGWLAAAALVAVLVALGARYGYHRDELYFIEGGRHLAWGQPDQPVGVPLLAHAWHWLVGGNLMAFRVLPALVSAGTVLVGALTARELGGDRTRQGWTAVAVALTSIVLGTGHLFSTTTFDLFGTALTLLLLIRAMRLLTLRAWVWVGLAAGLTLEVKTLVGVVLACCLVGIVWLGPRALFRTPGPYVAALVAGVLAAPYLIWQAAHGWPMLEVSANIAAGGSASSVPRALVIPMAALMLSPLFAVVAGFGVVWLLRREQRAAYGWLAVGFLTFLVFTVATGGKAYYPAGFFPAILAAGVIALPPLRTAIVVPLVVVNAIPTLWFALPIAPVGSGPFRIATAVNADGAETVGWPSYVATIAAVASDLPTDEQDDAIVLAGNYGEAGAVTLARRDGWPGSDVLPPAYSGHNAFGEWGPPPATATSAIVVGWWDAPDLATWFDSCSDVTRLRSPDGVDNEEDGAPVRVCSGLRQSWDAVWPDIRRLG